VPGLKVVCPSSPQDVYSLLRAAIADPDPVVFVENKALYGRKAEVDTGVRGSIGKAAIVRAGRDVTIVTYGATVHTALAAAQELAAQGVEAEVIDLRSVQPWDEACVFASVARTHRVVVVHEAVRAFGVGAEIAARIAEDAFDELDAPVVRVGAPFMPVPFTGALERRYMVNAEGVIAAVRKTLA
jgi:acetoin:2,6-dichlorophenolindophenol oxidoreductase subunit beta